MTNFIALFPLGIVVYPREQVNLHIFEPRYKQLIRECLEQKKAFGIPAVIENEVKEMGSLVEVMELSKEYESGEMDIKIKGIRVFRILEVIREVPDKLYGGAIVTYPEDEPRSNREIMRWIVQGMRQLHELLEINKDFSKADEDLEAYDIAHHLGLSLQEEYEVLELFQERQRQEYLKRHLTRVIPMIAEMDKLREKIRMNGHFRNLSGFSL
jgi:Lon protease-like protein